LKSKTGRLIPGMNNITIIQLNGNYRKLTIVNVYNDCTNSDMEVTLSTFLKTHADELLTDHSNIIWARDFRHHLLWDRDTLIQSRSPCLPENGRVRTQIHLKDENSLKEEGDWSPQSDGHDRVVIEHLR
jgi:hypothetical protein